MLFGKQAPPSSYQPPKPRRVVKSHKAAMFNVHWTPAEKALLEQAVDWRENQRLEKNLHHNREASSLGKHVIQITPVGTPASCSVCNRSNPNLGKLLLDSCGGSFDQYSAWSLQS